MFEDNTLKMHVFFFREDQNSKHSQEAKILLNDSNGSHKRLFELGVNFTLLSFSSACVICDPWLISNSTKKEKKSLKTARKCPYKRKYICATSIGVTCGVTVISTIGPRPHLRASTHSYDIPLIKFQSTYVLIQSLPFPRIRLREAILLV